MNQVYTRKQNNTNFRNTWLYSISYLPLVNGAKAWSCCGCEVGVWLLNKLSANGLLLRLLLRHNKSSLAGVVPSLAFFSGGADVLNRSKILWLAEGVEPAGTGSDGDDRKGFVFVEPAGGDNRSLVVFSFKRLSYTDYKWKC